MTRRFTPPFAVENYASLLQAYPGCRRRSERAPCRIPAELTLSSGSKLAGRVEELSESGVLFTGGTFLTPSESAELRFPEPTAGRIVLVRVTCRWSAPGKSTLAMAGLEFSDAPSPPVELFRRYVKLTRGGPTTE